MKYITETERIYLREFNPEDARHIFELHKDEDVVRFTGDRVKTLKEAGHEITQLSGSYKKYGFGRWAVIRKRDESFLGWCGLTYYPDLARVEVGFRFNKKFWGQGFATEATKSVISYGFSSIKLSKIYAHAHKLNKSSLKVMEKCGFTKIKEFEYNDVPVYLYVKKNPDLLIEFISAQETFQVRHPVLRPGRPLETCVFEGDDLKSTFHLGAFYNKNLVGVVTMMKSAEKTENVFQLRGMAVLDDYQKKGIGEELVCHAEEEVRKKGGTSVWMNARQVALNFYMKLGYEKFGEKFYIPKIGAHYKMKKKL
ncbi:Protein N-acetyltransferase, RimJ/RimL family [Zhouia amylolytica]|uniref:Protein N-acetyltransferase, RimJ/RimL family n=1 Tax=Zhouia amylolytica TaxID=376730 RepID=A0A1I6RQY0_9FLAO|nr:GNAT family N-acetyltransferase [Zhouia amylolytica]SFS67131.1 Protein N-acetyltransferase, RimJ/RimL family [Zhouia amylolytica]